MRPLLTFLFFPLCTALCVSAAEIPQGTHVLLRMVNSVSTRTAQDGDRVYLRTASPIATDGHIVVPVDSYVEGVVFRAKRGGKVSGRAELAIRLETLTFPNGQALKFTPRVASVEDNQSGQKVSDGEGTVKQAPNHGQDATRIAILAGSGASIGGLADQGWAGAGIGAAIGGAVGVATTLLTRGREAELRAGTTLDVVFDRRLALE